MALPWEAQKETVRHLYLEEDMTLHELRDAMENRHNFKARANQFERQLKKWGYRKNLTAREWNTVSWRIEQRRAEGKRTDLRINGIQVPDKKQQKALARYGYGPTLEVLKRKHAKRSSYRSPTPEGVSFSPPPVSLSPHLNLDGALGFKFPISAIPVPSTQPEIFQNYCAAVIGNPQTDVQRLAHALPSDLDAAITRSFQSLLDASTNSETFAATIFAVNNIQIPSQFTIGPYGKFELFPYTQDLVWDLESPYVRHEPLLDAVLEQLFKEALVTGNVDLAKRLLVRFDFNLADALPGPWRNERGEMSSLDSQMPLEVAIATGSVQLVQMLLDHGADANVTTSRYDVLTIAAQNRNWEILQLLLPRFHRNLMPTLLVCLRNQLFSSTDMIWGKIMRSGPRLAHEEADALCAAAKWGNFMIASDLLRLGVDANVVGKEGLTPLQAVALSHRSSAEMAKLLISCGAEVDYRLKRLDTLGPTALQLAVCTNNLKVAEVLVSAGAEIDPQRCSFQPNCSEWSRRELLSQDLINIAAMATNTGCLGLLLNVGTNANDWTLACAVEARRREAIGLLLNLNVRPSTRTLVSAARVGYWEMVRHCLDAGVDVNSSVGETTVLVATIESPHYGARTSRDVFRISTLLLDHGAKLDLPRVGEPLRRAVLAGRTDVFDLLISRGAEFDAKDLLLQACYVDEPYFLERILEFVWTQPGLRTLYTTTHFGCQALCAVFANDNSELCTAFLRSGISLKNPCATKALQQACFQGDIGLIERLLDAGCPINLPENVGDLCCWGEVDLEYRLQPLQILALGGHSEAMRLLLSHGADANGSGVQLYNNNDVWIHDTILSSAVRGGRLICVEILLEADADVNRPACGDFGRTALQSAAETGSMEIVENLICAGADVNAPPAEYGGATALQAAALGGFVGIATRLVGEGADVDASAAPEEGRTALEGAAEHGRISMVQFLLDAGTDLQSPWFGDFQYQNAVGLARSEGFNAVARLLERHRRSLPPLF